MLATDILVVRAVRREPAVPDGHRRHGVVRPRRVFRRSARTPRRSRSSTACRWRRRSRSRRSPRSSGALVFGWFCVRLSGVYLAMLTLAFAQIVWSIAFQWDSVTGGSNGLVGVWPPAWLAGTPRLLLVHAGADRGVALAAIAWIAHAPFGYALRACRDSPLRAEAHRHRRARARNGRRSRSPARSPGSPAASTRSPRAASRRRRSRFRARSTRSSWCCWAASTRSPGRCIGAAAFTWLSDTLARATEYWRARARRRDPAHRPRVPDGHRRRAASALLARGAAA